MIYQRNALRGHALIIELVVAQQILHSQLPHRGVVGDAQKIGQNLLPNLLRKGLSFGYVFLPVPFRAMPEHFMEENRRRAPGQQSRTN